MYFSGGNQIRESANATLRKRRKTEIGDARVEFSRDRVRLGIKRLWCGVVFLFYHHHLPMSLPATSPRRSRSIGSSSSRASSSRTELLSDDTPPTSMSGSFYHTGNHCQCELSDEAELRDLYREHSEYTEGLWTGPVPLSEWKGQFLPPDEFATARKLDFQAVPSLNGQTAFVRARYTRICEHPSLMQLLRLIASAKTASVPLSFPAPPTLYTARTTLATSTTRSTSQSYLKSWKWITIAVALAMSC